MKLWSISEQGSKSKAKDTLSAKDRKWIMVFLIGAQGFLTAGTVFALMYNMGNTWQFLLGLNLFVFAGLFRTFKNGLKKKPKIISQQNSFSENHFSLTDEKTYSL